MELNLMVVIEKKLILKHLLSKNYINKMELNLMVVIEEKLILKHLLSCYIIKAEAVRIGIAIALELTFLL